MRRVGLLKNQLLRYPGTNLTETVMSTKEQQILHKDISELLPAVSSMKAEGNRLVGVCATSLGDTVQVDYLFDRDFLFQILRVTIARGGELPSITGSYFAAFSYENEIHDLFGITVTGNALDFGGRFYQTAVKHPFLSDEMSGGEPCQNK